MGKHTEDRSTSPAPGAAGPARRTLLLLTLGITATLVAWGVLVFAAIDLGQAARGGEGLAWFFVGLTTLGAAACLFVTLILGARAVTLLKGREQPPPKPLGGRRRAGS